MDKQSPSKPILKRYWLPGLIIILVLAAVASIPFFLGEKKGKTPERKDSMGEANTTTQTTDTAKPQESDKFITANPVDLTQIKVVTKFRSCSGHEYSGTNFTGETEVSSSMKHYFEPLDSLKGTKDQIKIFAPFNGTVVRIDPMDTWRGRQFIIKHEPFNGWYLTFVHVEINEKVVEGAKVKAGDLLGYANMTQNSGSFDISLQRFKTDPGTRIGENLYINLEPIFPHMVDSVYQKFVARGVTTENTFISKATRDAAPCQCRENNPGSTRCQYDREADKEGPVTLN